MLKVVTGVASSTPVAPVLQRDNFIYEISLARILVRGNTVQLLQSDLVDERLDENLCGLVYSLISIPTSQFQAEWDAFMVGVQNDSFTPLDAFNAHTAEDVTDAHNATSISVADIANKFTATNIEDALLELFTFANDGKTAVASAVTAKGVTASPTDTFSALATKIGQISTGKKFATGTATSTGATSSFTRVNNSSVNYYRLIVTGLDFEPSLISVRLAGNAAVNVTYDKNITGGPISMTSTRTGSLIADACKSISPAVVDSTGFTLPMFQANLTFTWVAYE